jgi:hypothetical protein
VTEFGHVIPMWQAGSFCQKLRQKARDVSHPDVAQPTQAVTDVVAAQPFRSREHAPRYAAEQARDARILEVRGVEPESGMPVAGLHALFYPVRSYLTSLSDPQCDALSAALGFASGQVSSRFLVAAAVVELLATLAEEQPVLS